jgi:hypothetical protein
LKKRFLFRLFIFDLPAEFFNAMERANSNSFRKLFQSGWTEQKTAARYCPKIRRAGSIAAANPFGRERMTVACLKPERLTLIFGANEDCSGKSLKTAFVIFGSNARAV